MRLRPAAVPSVDPVPAPADGGLLDREHAAHDAERAVASEADALARAVASLDAEVQALVGRAAALERDGHPEAEWLLARFHSHRMDAPDLSGPAGQSLAARNHALAARARAVEMARVLLQAGASSLEEHRAGLARDAVELQRVEAAAREARAEEARRAEAARKQVEQQQAEARRAEAARKQVQQQQAEAHRREMVAAAGQVQHPSPALARAAEPVPALSAAARARAPGQPLGKLSAPTGTPGRRDGPRIPLQTQVDLSSDSNLFTGFSTNVSEGGLFVATVNVLPVGTPVDLSFSLPEGTRIAVQGEVRWTRELDDRAPDVFPGVGVRFVGLAPEAAEALHRFVGEREPLFYPD